MYEQESLPLATVQGAVSRRCQLSAVEDPGESFVRHLLAVNIRSIFETSEQSAFLPDLIAVTILVRFLKFL